MNKERLIAVRDFIQEHKDRFDYGRYGGFIGHKSDVGSIPNPHSCNTCGCIAGWTQALTCGGNYDMRCETYSREYLELEHNEAAWLFYAEIPNQKGTGNENLFNTRYGTVDEALNRLNHLIEHGTIDGYKYPEVDWSLVDEDKYNVA